VTSRNLFVDILNDLYKVNLCSLCFYSHLYHVDIYYYSSDSFLALARSCLPNFKSGSAMSSAANQWTRRPSGGCGQIRDLDWSIAGKRERRCYALAENSFSFGIAPDSMHVHSFTYVFLTKHFRMTRLEHRGSTHKIYNETICFRKFRNQISLNCVSISETQFR